MPGLAIFQNRPDASDKNKKSAAAPSGEESKEVTWKEGTEFNEKPVPPPPRRMPSVEDFYESFVGDEEEEGLSFLAVSHGRKDAPTQPPNAGGSCGGGGGLAMFQKRLPTNDNSTVAVPTATAVAASQPEDELPPQESQTAPVTAGGVPDAAALTNVHQPTQRTDEDVSMEEPTESFSPRLSYRIRKRDEIGAHTCHMDALGGKHVDTPRAAAAEMPPEEEPYQEEKEPEDTPRTMVAATGVFQGQNNVQVHPLVTPGLRADAGSVVVQPATATTQTRDYDVQLSDKDIDWDQYKWEEGQKDFATKDQKAGDLLETFEEEYWQGLSTLETAYSSLLKLQHDTFDSLNETAEMEAMVDWLLAEHEAY